MPQSLKTQVRIPGPAASRCRPVHDARFWGWGLSVPCHSTDKGTEGEKIAEWGLWPSVPPGKTLHGCVPRGATGAQVTCGRCQCGLWLSRMLVEALVPGWVGGEEVWVRARVCACARNAVLAEHFQCL